MIEKIQAQNGRDVLRYQGRLLASTFDPEAEARAWVSRRPGFLDHVKAIFILGAGSGYHIAELARQTTARLVVVEHSPELARAVIEIHGFQPPKVRFEILAKPADLRSNDIIRDAVKNSFVVLTHPATRACHPEFYAECERQFLARDWGSLNWQWQLKGHGSLDSQTQLSADNASPLTIYDLEKTELSQNSEQRERMLIKALRELVK